VVEFGYGEYYPPLSEEVVDFVGAVPFLAVYSSDFNYGFQ